MRALLLAICVTTALPPGGETRWVGHQGLKSLAIPTYVGTRPAERKAREELAGHSELHLKLRTGGEISGKLVDYTDHGLVIVKENVPYVFAWIELDGGSAYDARRSIMLAARGGISRLNAEDHFDLGLFALLQGRVDLAKNAFMAAGKLDKRLVRRGENAIIEHRRSTLDRAEMLMASPHDSGGSPLTAKKPSADESGDDRSQPGAFNDESVASTDPLPGPALWETLPARADAAELREQVRNVYLQFGEKVRQVLGKDILLIESEHFLIWTDWPLRERRMLAELFESMYAALCEQFGLDAREDIFLAKCPAFCFQRPGRFRKFAQRFDGYSGKDAAGYSRSIEANGHVHLVLVRQGDSPIDLDRFATTLVHEGTHAFVHRLYSNRLIPHWVNEGLAELMAERLLKERSVTGENAALLARQYAIHDWPVQPLLESTGPIGVHQYALAHSIVAFLEARGRSPFASFIRGLKDGKPTTEALAAAYDGMTLDELEQKWREQSRNAD